MGQNKVFDKAYSQKDDPGLKRGATRCVPHDLPPSGRKLHCLLKVQPKSGWLSTKQGTFGMFLGDGAFQGRFPLVQRNISCQSIPQFGPGILQKKVPATQGTDARLQVTFELGCQFHGIPPKVYHC